jgi:hypothetical protein
MAGRLGYANVEFLRGRIQDLALSLDALDAWLRAHPVRSAADLARLEEVAARLRREEPLVPDACVDLVVSNCVPSLVRPEHKEPRVGEIFRVLRRGERVAVCAETDEILTRDPDAGCVIPLPARKPIPEGERALFDCSRTAPRHPRETQGEAYRLTTSASQGREPEGCC